MLSISAENIIKAVNTEKRKLVHLLFEVAKGCLPVKNVGQLLDPKINLGDPPKDLVEEWTQNDFLSVIPFWVQY